MANLASVQGTPVNSRAYTTDILFPLRVYKLLLKSNNSIPSHLHVDRMAVHPFLLNAALVIYIQPPSPNHTVYVPSRLGTFHNSSIEYTIIFLLL